jgi:hypothetical protein
MDTGRDRELVPRKRKIVGYHLDPESPWIAELKCGHEQHVRHAFAISRLERVHNADEIMAEIVAKRLVERLERAGFGVTKKPPPDRPE